MRRLAGEGGRIARHVARGLKLDDDADLVLHSRRAPRARGLKHSGRRHSGSQHQSRPRVGAWIETSTSFRDSREWRVREHVVARIETR
jgi:hypothetical protein